MGFWKKVEEEALKVAKVFGKPVEYFLNTNYEKTKITFSLPSQIPPKTCTFHQKLLLLKNIPVQKGRFTIMEEILDLLRENARLSVEDIAAMTKKTVDEVKEIIAKLEADGIILKYAAIVNPEKDNENKGKVCAEIEIQVTPQREHGFDAIADRIYRFPQVKSLYLMSGGYDLKVIIEGDSLKEVAFFVSSKLATLDGVRSTKTHFILKTYKENDILYVENERDRREGAMA